MLWHLGNRHTLPPTVRDKQKSEKLVEYNCVNKRLHKENKQDKHIQSQSLLTANDHDTHNEKKRCNGQSSMAQGLIIWTYKTQIKHSILDTTGNDTKKHSQM